MFLLPNAFHLQEASCRWVQLRKEITNNPLAMGTSTLHLSGHPCLVPSSFCQTWICSPIWTNSWTHSSPRVTPWLLPSSLGQWNGFLHGSDLRQWDLISLGFYITPNCQFYQRYPSILGSGSHLSTAWFLTPCPRKPPCLPGPNQVF